MCSFVFFFFSDFCRLRIYKFYKEQNAVSRLSLCKDVQIRNGGEVLNSIMEIDPTILSCISVSSRSFRGVSSTKVKKRKHNLCSCTWIWLLKCDMLSLIVQGSSKSKPKKLYKVIYLKSKHSTLTLIFSVVPPPHSSHLFHLSSEKSSGCCANQSWHAFFTSSSDLKWCPRWACFRAQRRWKSLGAKSGEYGEWVNTSNSKS